MEPVAILNCGIKNQHSNYPWGEAMTRRGHQEELHVPLLDLSNGHLSVLALWFGDVSVWVLHYINI